MVYNQDKTIELTEYDLEKGYLQDDEIIIHHEEVIGQEEEWHYEVIAEYENGGKDIEKIIDKPHIDSVDAYDEHILIKVYIPYTEEELQAKEKEKIIENKKREIDNVKSALAKTDYEALKYAEGWFTEEEYAPIKQEREDMRNIIRTLEDEFLELIK